LNIPRLVLALSVAAPILLNGQTPAVSTPPITGVLTGIVRDSAGQPLANVDITLLAENTRTRTDTRGYFALRELSLGGHTAVFRHIEYQSVQYRWVVRDSQERRIDVTMRPVVRQLGPVVTEAQGSARRRGASAIQGVGSDADRHGVEGADVRLLGSGLSTVTDAEGRFVFGMLPPLSYIVRVRRRDFASANSVVQLADSETRGITIRLSLLGTHAGDRSEASGYGVADVAFSEFDRRRRVNASEDILGPADLFRAEGASLEFVLQRYRDGTMSSGGDACLLINGRQPVSQPLHAFTAVEVQLVEVARRSDFDDGFLASQMESLPACRAKGDRHPTYFVLWTRSLR
jgi:hypothetical protein